LRSNGDLIQAQAALTFSNHVPIFDVHSGFRAHMSYHGGQCFDIHTVFQCHGGEGVPLRYNYDKPEKPRISRVFGYPARFFILFQTEKSSREVIIS
jgi:hypothetical protein